MSEEEWYREAYELVKACTLHVTDAARACVVAAAPPTIQVHPAANVNQIRDIRITKDEDAVDFNTFIGPTVVAKITKLLGGPLAADSSLPEPMDLSSWWDKVERVLLSINKRVRLEDLNVHGCAHLAPLLLGDVAWKVIKDCRITDWEDFHIEVDRRFGLLASDLQEALH